MIILNPIFSGIQMAASTSTNHGWKSIYFIKHYVFSKTWNPFWGLSFIKKKMHVRYRSSAELYWSATNSAFWIKMDSSSLKKRRVQIINQFDEPRFGEVEVAKWYHVGSGVLNYIKIQRWCAHMYYITYTCIDNFFSSIRSNKYVNVVTVLRTYVLVPINQTPKWCLIRMVHLGKGKEIFWWCTEWYEEQILSVMIFSDNSEYSEYFRAICSLRFYEKQHIAKYFYRPATQKPM